MDSTGGLDWTSKRITYMVSCSAESSASDLSARGRIWHAMYCQTCRLRPRKPICWTLFQYSVLRLTSFHLATDRLVMK